MLGQRLQETHPPALVGHLLASHGLQAEAVLACAATAQECEPLSPVIPLTAAEVRHAVRQEWALSAEDVLARRCRLAFVDTAEAERLTRWCRSWWSRSWRRRRLPPRARGRPPSSDRPQGPSSCSAQCCTVNSSTASAIEAIRRLCSSSGIVRAVRMALSMLRWE